MTFRCDFAGMENMHRVRRRSRSRSSRADFRWVL